MKNVFFFDVAEQTELERALELKLSEYHELLKVYIEPGYLWGESIKDVVRKADVVIVPITQGFLDSKSGGVELNYILSYAKENDEKLILIVVFGDLPLPPEVREFLYISIDPNSANAIDGAVGSINRAISSYEGRRAAKVEQITLKAEKIERKSAAYVEEAIAELRTRENSLKSSATLWYRLGYAAIVIGVVASALIAAFGGTGLSSDKSSWDVVVYIAIKNIVLIGLLLAMAKYSFTLAKAYMEEALKNADRIHAISFGKFFLQAFSEEANATNVKDIFQHWNISGNNAFSKTASEVIDPKVFELVTEFAKAMQDASKKKE
ncbi:TIR domain-containing protein [Pseudomonas sp. JV449]|uniref:TIR domain-containing protein n=1 Tax=Pseudomonas sp. JV449 TaxID=1890658 RepID=UPI0028E18094|nr:TIR domain-containing protein [Pseudomonas sp. JV449]MDT9633810.1 TIR domain-containing protein [Pseudomonas sp. JV449]